MPRDYEDDDRPRRRRPRDDDFDDDRPRRRSRRDDDDDRPARPPAKQVSILGIFSLVKGIGALLLSFFPCVGAVAIFPGLLGLFLGIIGLVVAKKSHGRQGTGLPIAGTIVSGAAVVIALIWIVVVGGFSARSAAVREQEEAEVQAAGDAVAVTAADLDRAFETNELKAEADYKGKVLAVTGTIKTIVRDRPGVVVVELRAGPDSTVDCEFRRDAEGPLAGRNIGDQITIRGKCKGRSRGWVTLEHCMVAGAPAVTPPKAGPVKDAPAAKGGNVIRVTAVQFAREYEDDEAAADRKYKDKVLEVTGVVDGAEFEDDPDGYVLQLKGVLRGLKDVTVDCLFAKTPAVRAKLAALGPGKTVTIRGKCTDHTTLEACVLVE